jgi:hypothetical protein
MNLNPFRTRRCTVLADARPGGALPPLDRAELARVDAALGRTSTRSSASSTRVGAEVVSPPSRSWGWRVWIPLALVPVGGAVGFGVATLVGLRACARMAVAAAGGVTLGAGTAAAIALGDAKDGGGP